ncbi:DPP IV N-terminal domain-containing protein [bacterium]|nr:DPP IV N-terminal domain-containing protein [bacterium]
MGKRWIRVSTVLFAALAVAAAGADIGSGSGPRPQRARVNPAREGVITNTRWSEDGRCFEYVHHLKQYRVDLQTLSIAEIERTSPIDGEERRSRRRNTAITVGGRTIERPERGHQYLTEVSPDGQWFACCRDWNVVLESVDGSLSIPVTTEGHRKFRYGTANWTYGEELDVRHGMWWSPDSKKLIYYVFDERPVKDFYLLGNLTKINTSLLVEGYIKAGAPNPVVWLEIYDLEKRARIPVDCGHKERDQYIYNMRFTPDGHELLFNRTDRLQHDLEVVALDAESGETRIVLSEHQDTWQENSPDMRFLADGKRFIWETEKTGFRHFELRHIDGRLLTTLTRGDYPDQRIIRVDEPGGWLYYTARNGSHPLCDHLNRVRLDGSGQARLTRSELNHTSFDISPDGQWFVVRFESVETPPSTALYSTGGDRMKMLAAGPAEANPRAELFSFKAADGKTDLYGILYKPADFNENRRYPLVISVYGGPGSRAVSNRYTGGSPYNDNGFLVARIDNLGTSGRGKAFKAAVYRRLGDVDIRGQAQGVRYLRRRPYVDGSRVGIVGHSYGGYMAAMGIVKYPDVFTVAVDRAGPTDWRNYDSIYTERYMGLPDDNPEGYGNASVMHFAGNLQGKLLIMHGLVDDNVHPTNAFQLIKALDDAQKPYDSRFFPLGTHGFGGYDTQDAFLKRHLLQQ